MTLRMRRHLRRLFDESKPVYAQRTIKLDKVYERGDLFTWKEDGIDLTVVQRLFRVRMLSHNQFGDGTREGRAALIASEEKRLAPKTDPAVDQAEVPKKAAGKSRK